jgi:hypothetical protein
VFRLTAADSTIQGESFFTREEMRRKVFEYIEVDYNSNRRYSA